MPNPHQRSSAAVVAVVCAHDRLLTRHKGFKELCVAALSAIFFARMHKQQHAIIMTAVLAVHQVSSAGSLRLQHANHCLARCGAANRLALHEVQVKQAYLVVALQDEAVAEPEHMLSTGLWEDIALPALKTVSLLPLLCQVSLPISHAHCLCPLHCLLAGLYPCSVLMS